jgi:hypothetical protein
LGHIFQIYRLISVLFEKCHFGIDKALYSKIKKKAKKLHKSEDTLIKEWLSEKAEDQALPL